MPFLAHPALVCPIDGVPLQLEGRRLVCAEGHNFDLARQGYANLLLSHQKRSRQPGDSREMVAARHAFLAQGYYAPLLEYLSDGLMPRLRDGATVVDAGCGEGYYLAGLLARVQARGLRLHGIGIDISKWALQVAARRCPATWLVASNRAIPVNDAGADVVLDLFGFIQPAEFARVLKPGGLLLRATAGPEHLLALRSLLYDEVEEKTPPSTSVTGFDLAHRERLQFTFAELAQPAIGQLLTMTPHGFRASRDARERVLALETLSVGVDITIEYFSRASAAGT